MWVRTYRKQKSFYQRNEPEAKEYILKSAWHIFHSYRVLEDGKGVSTFALTNDGYWLDIPGVQFKEELVRKDNPCRYCNAFHQALTKSAEIDFKDINGR